MEIVSTKPAKPTKQKKYMYVCKACQRDYSGGFNHSSTTFIANFPEDFHSSITGRFYCCCPNCNYPFYTSPIARLRYWIYKKNQASALDLQTAHKERKNK